MLPASVSQGERASKPYSTRICAIAWGTSPSGSSRASRWFSGVCHCERTPTMLGQRTSPCAVAAYQPGGVAPASSDEIEGVLAFARDAPGSAGKLGNSTPSVVDGVDDVGRDDLAFARVELSSEERPSVSKSRILVGSRRSVGLPASWLRRRLAACFRPSVSKKRLRGSVGRRQGSALRRGRRAPRQRLSRHDGTVLDGDCGNVGFVLRWRYFC